MRISENIKRIREEKQMTQGELADRVGVSRPMIAQIERGTKGVSLLLGAAIADVFECSIEDLMKDG